MAYEETQRRISLDADASVALYTGISGMPGAASPNYGRMYSFVKVTGTHQCGLSTAVGDNTVGITQNKPQKLGSAVEVAMITAGGVSLLIAGTGGLTAGDRVKPDANGHGVTSGGAEAGFATVIEGAAAGAAASVLMGRC